MSVPNFGVNSVQLTNFCIAQKVNVDTCESATWGGAGHTPQRHTPAEHVTTARYQYRQGLPVSAVPAVPKVETINNLPI